MKIQVTMERWFDLKATSTTYFRFSTKLFQKHPPARKFLSKTLEDTLRSLAERNVTLHSKIFKPHKEKRIQGKTFFRYIHIWYNFM